MRRTKELVCGSTATLARTLPGTLPSIGLQFGIVGRQFRATLMSFAAALLLPFGSLFPLGGDFGQVLAGPSCLHQNSPMDALRNQECKPPAEEFLPFWPFRKDPGEIAPKP